MQTNFLFIGSLLIHGFFVFTSFELKTSLASNEKLLNLAPPFDSKASLSQQLLICLDSSISSPSFFPSDLSLIWLALAANIIYEHK